MEHPEAARHPLLDLCGLRIPGPVLPIILALWFLSTRLRHMRRGLRLPLTGHRLRILLVVTHSLTYFWSIWNIIHQEQHTGTPLSHHALILIEFVTLTWGEAFLPESDIWPYTLTSIGWIMLALHPLSKATSPSWRHIWLPLMLSLSSVLQVGGRVSSGAMLSGISLLSTVIFGLVDNRNVLGSYGGILAIFFPPCLATLVQLVCKNDSFYDRLRSLWRAIFKQYPTENNLQCAQVAISVINLQAAGWIVSSYLWSCLPWRWLFSEQNSKDPALTVFSLAGGSVFFAIHAVCKLLRNRAPIADPAIFVRNSLSDCFHAIQWTNCIYLGLWSLCELSSMYH